MKNKLFSFLVCLLITQAYCIYHIPNEAEINDQSFSITLYDYTQGLRTDVILKKILQYDNRLGYVTNNECITLPEELWSHVSSIKTYDKRVMVYTDEHCESNGVEYNVPRRLFLGEWIDPNVKSFRSC